MCVHQKCSYHIHLHCLWFSLLFAKHMGAEERGKRGEENKELVFLFSAVVVKEFFMFLFVVLCGFQYAIKQKRRREN